MGTVAALSAVRPPRGPSLDAERETCRERLRASLVEPYPSVEAEFGLTLDGLWRDLLRVFSGGAEGDYPLAREWLLADSEAWASPEGVWAVRGRRRAYPLWDRPGPAEAEHLDEVRILFNDGGDVTRIAGWLEDGPTEAFVSYFRSRHETYVDEMTAGGASADEIERYAGGGRNAAPYLGIWEDLLGFYRRTSGEGLWVKSFIG